MQTNAEKNKNRKEKKKDDKNFFFWATNFVKAPKFKKWSVSFIVNKVTLKLNQVYIYIYRKTYEKIKNSKYKNFT